MMKALSLWQPWASLIPLGVKTIETRSWSTSYRGPLLICSAKRSLRRTGWPGPDPVVGSDSDGWQIGDAIGEGGLINPRSLPLGAAVALADLVDCVPIYGIGDAVAKGVDHYLTECNHDGDLPQQQGGLWLIGTGLPNLGRPTRVEDQRPYGDFTPGRYGWLLDNIRPLREPIPVKGRQGLWTPDADLVAAVEAAS
jgi:hypothetical protein